MIRPFRPDKKNGLTGQSGCTEQRAGVFALSGESLIYQCNPFMTGLRCFGVIKSRGKSTDWKQAVIHITTPIPTVDLLRQFSSTFYLFLPETLACVPARWPHGSVAVLFNYRPWLLFVDYLQTFIPGKVNHRRLPAAATAHCDGTGVELSVEENQRGFTPRTTRFAAQLHGQQYIPGNTFRGNALCPENALLRILIAFLHIPPPDSHHIWIFLNFPSKLFYGYIVAHIPLLCKWFIRNICLFFNVKLSQKSRKSLYLSGYSRKITEPERKVNFLTNSSNPLYR